MEVIAYLLLATEHTLRLRKCLKTGREFNYTPPDFNSNSPRMDGCISSLAACGPGVMVKNLHHDLKIAGLIPDRVHGDLLRRAEEVFTESGFRMP